MIDWKSTAKAFALVAAPLALVAASVAAAHVGGAAPNPRGARWDVYWVDPDTKRWAIYGSNLSRTAADKLAFKVTYVLSPRWGHDNVKTKVVPAGETP